MRPRLLQEVSVCPEGNGFGWAATMKADDSVGCRSVWGRILVIFEPKPK